METAHPAFTLVLALSVGVLAQSFARHARVPGIVPLLVAGVALGPDGLGWVQPEALGEGLLSIVQLAVAVILFEGGLNLEISRLRREQSAIRKLVSWGALLTAAGGALAVWLVLGWSLTTSLLFGTLVVVTGPTVIGPIVQQLRLRPRVATVLEAEGVLIDPVGAILAVLMLEVALSPGGGTLDDSATSLLLRLGFGAGAGAVAGFAIAFLLRLRRVVPEGFENIFVLSTVLLLAAGSDEVVSESGILAVVIAGVVVGNLRSRYDRDLREFKDQLTVLMIGLLFVLLAADVRLDSVRGLGWNGVLVVALLCLVVRPLVVWICTAGSELTRNERLFIAWISPRGVAAAAVASVTASALAAAGIEGGTELRALVFLTIGITVALAGLTAAPVASLLRVRQPGRDAIVVLGAEALGLTLGEALRAGGRSVVFIDSNPQYARQAQERGFSVVFGNALQERTLQRARLGSADAVVGLTTNQVLNSVFASRARELFRVPISYIGVTAPGQGMAMELVEEGHARVLFDGPHDVERWDVRVRRDEVTVERWTFVGEPERAGGEEAPGAKELFVILTTERAGKADPMYATYRWRENDVASVAVYGGDEAEAHRVLRAWGFVPAEAEPGEAHEAAIA